MGQVSEKILAFFLFVSEIFLIFANELTCRTLKQTAYGDIKRQRKEIYVEASAESCHLEIGKIDRILQEKVDDSRPWA